MKIVLATQHFNEIGGSEAYLITVAEQLMRLGHLVTVYCLEFGKMAELARSRGLEVVDKSGELPVDCDVAITQDGGMAYELAERWPQTPQLHVCHSTWFDFQLPPMVPGVASGVVVLSDRFGGRIAALDPRHHVFRLRQPVDVERLTPRGAPRDRPRRALLLGNYLRGETRRLIADTWAAAGVEVVQVGTPTRTNLQPEADIAAADIVVGKGRAILDAMSCGRPAYLYDVYGTDGWVTPETYPLMEADAFVGQALQRSANVDLLRRDLDAYDPKMGQVNREIVLTNHQSRMHADRLVAICREVAPRAAVPTTTPLGELARLTRLNWRAEGELFGLRHEFATYARRTEKATIETARLRTELADAHARARRLEQELHAFQSQRRVRLGLAIGRFTDRLRTILRRQR